MDIVDLKSFSHEDTFTEQPGNIFALRYSPDGSRMAVGGDFEITLAFEILQAQTPTPASYGVGVLMSINETLGRVGRLVRAQRPVASWDRWTSGASTT